jgi:hypothetical protein
MFSELAHGPFFQKLLHKPRQYCGKFGDGTSLVIIPRGSQTGLSLRYIIRSLFFGCGQACLADSVALQNIQ